MHTGRVVGLESAIQLHKDAVAIAKERTLCATRKLVSFAQRNRESQRARLPCAGRLELPQNPISCSIALEKVITIRYEQIQLLCVLFTYVIDSAVLNYS